VSLQVLLQRILFAFGIGFLIANILIIVDLIRFSIRKRSALLVWQGEKPRLYGFSLALGVMLGLLFVSSCSSSIAPFRRCSASR